MTIDELKRTVRELRKLKKSLRVGSSERKDINKKLKTVKDILKTLLTPDDEKQRVIRTILAIYSRIGRTPVVNLLDFSTDQLRVHLEKLNKGRY